MSTQPELDFDRPPPARSDLEAAFLAFHRANPEVYRLFVRFALEAARAGRSRFGARMIWNRIRWFTDVETKESSGLKLNNNHTPYYARLFARDYPEHALLFETRRVRDGESHDD